MSIEKSRIIVCPMLDQPVEGSTFCMAKPKCEHVQQYKCIYPKVRKGQVCQSTSASGTEPGPK